MRTRMTSSAAVCTSVTKSPWSGRVDEPDVAVVPHVNDGCPTGLRVGEEEEIVPQQVHLEGRFFGCHRLDCELLVLADPGPSLVYLVRLFVGLIACVGCARGRLPSTRR